MTDALTPDELDQATIDLIFALRDSLTDVSPLDFWGGRAATALATAAAGADTIQQAVTIAARKLQIEVIDAKASPVVVDVAKRLDPHFAAWATHLEKTLVYIIALARAINGDARAAKQAAYEARQAAKTAVVSDALPTF